MEVLFSGIPAVNMGFSTGIADQFPETERRRLDKQN
jgi:hypothetical protein